ncbi:mitochondrial type II fatty acid synthase component [Nadsonia fulvescens var. elongata DSM 6958]|uniref:Acyl carrier protein n=1 Tax=Nadsonia fulvescens var. elongata DSM 6958 TaxID=857566 RepID=A0A1E3PGS2_9ASCO|nr:mitochondrial type II fatty acid synthase component [Nadsonia fulvescens var. elongata DSM 6958]
MFRLTARRVFSQATSVAVLPRATPQFVRFYSTPLVQTDVEKRVIDVVKAFDKISDPTKITATSHFNKDLNLDSLDTVEVVVAIEEEFDIEIPDKEADEIKTISQAVQYILAQSDAK